MRTVPSYRIRLCSSLYGVLVGLVAETAVEDGAQAIVHFYCEAAHSESIWIGVRVYPQPDGSNTVHTDRYYNELYQLY